MYNSFYGFSEKPFEVVPDHTFFYFTSSHRDALTTLIDGLKERRGFISITGEVGTGKTTLIHLLLKSLDEKVKTVFIFHTTLSFEELLRTILVELDLTVIGEDKQALLSQLKGYLMQIAEDETVAVIIDEAQDLSEEVAEEIGRRLGTEKWVSRRPQVIFFGQPEFEHKLKSQGLRQLSQCIAIRREIEALSKEESEAYIDHRLKRVGSSRSRLFTPEAIALIVSYAQGIPRVINVLCDQALLIGYGSSKKKIDADIIREAINDMEGPLSKKPWGIRILMAAKRLRSIPLGLSIFPKRMSIAILSLSCLGILIFLAYGFIQQRTSGKVVSIQPSGSQKPPSSMSPSSRTPTEEISNNESRHSPREQELDSPKSHSPAPPPPVSPIPRNGSDLVEKTVVVQKGQTISSLAQEYYGVSSATLAALIQEFNPEIANVHLISEGQVIRLPKITQERLVIQSPDLTYAIHVGTFWTRSFSKRYADEPTLKGKKIEIVPRKVSPQDTWYRVEIGKFANRQEALEVVHRLKEKGLLPLFENVPGNK